MLVFSTRNLQHKNQMVMGKIEMIFASKALQGFDK